MQHRTLEYFERGLISVMNAYQEGDVDLEGVLCMADKVLCYKANEGINVKRLPHNPREQAFHDQWQQENAPVAGVNNGHGILQDLFIENDRSSAFKGRIVVEEMSNRDRRIVATIIQWLGSNVGMCFLGDALKRFDARIVYDKNPA